MSRYIDLPEFDFNEFTVENIAECLKNGGYELSRIDNLNFARDNGALKYCGFFDKKHIFHIIIECGKYSPYSIHVVHIWLGADGKFVGVVTDEPILSGMTELLLNHFKE